jgi:hypothetical protein
MQPVPYQTRNKASSLDDFKYAPEELDIREALKAYDWDLRYNSVDDFVPTRVLYQAYSAFTENWKKPTLNPTQFGCALRRAFGLDPDRKSRRRVGGGPPINGYTFVKLKEKNVPRPDPPALVQTACPLCGGAGVHYLGCTGPGD